MSLPDYLQPFVLPVETVAPQRCDNVDLYVSTASEPAPAIIFVHGGPVPAALRPTPRDWPVYRGYGSLAASRGLVGVTVDHRLHDVGDYPIAAADVDAAVQLVRADPRVNADRIALWYFSGGGLLLADRLRSTAGWLRCVAATYPILAPLPGWAVAPEFRPIDAVGTAGAPPIVLTRVGLERPPVAESVEAFVAAARARAARLTVIDVPHGRHGFDMLDHTDESRNAVVQALDSVIEAIA